MTSNHEGVSCDLCRKSNFRGLRYKCLICYDYDLCPTCYESGLTSSRHTNCHPVQCIVARNDYDLFYAGESTSSEQPLSFTCPLCGSLGFSESTLLEHVTNEHANSDNGESSAGVVCPICGVETNQLTYDFATHLTMEHRAPRGPIEEVTTRGRGGRSGIVCGGFRGRRPLSHYRSVGGPTGLSPSARETSTDPLVEILAQLSSVRRTGGASNQSSASQLHQLQQLHLQSSPPSAARTNNDREVRLMRRTFQTMTNQNLNSSSTSTSTAIPSSGIGQSNLNAHYCSTQPFILMDQSSLGPNLVGSSNNPTGGSSNNVAAAGSCTASQSGVLQNQPESSPSQYLLPRCMKPTMTEAELQQREILRADRSLFVQELLFQLGSLEGKMN